MDPELYERYVDITGRKLIKYYVMWRLIELGIGLLVISIFMVIGYLVLSGVESSFPKININ